MARVPDRICRVGGPDASAYTYFPVVVIGAGESGICMGARLQQVLGFDQFRIFERKSQLGGTWYTNVYPGIACDVPAIMYSFSFAQNSAWTAAYPSGPEICRYLYDVCSRFKLLDKIQCDTNVKSARWIDADEEWQLELEYLAPGVGDMSTVERRAVEERDGTKATILRTETVRAKIVASAVGGLVEPKSNLEIPGLEKFEGDLMHTARWDRSVDLRDKDVVVVGTGCSAAQVVASLVKPEYGVNSLTQLLRSPPWVTPSVPKDIFSGWIATACTHVPGFQDLLRKAGFAGAEIDFLSHFPKTERARKGRKATADRLLRYMRKRVPAEYHDILTPNYEVFCKRRVIDDGWFEALRDPRASITSQPLTSVGTRSVTLGPGRHYPPMDDPNVTTATAPIDQRELPCDVLIQAHGFATNEWLHPLNVIGRDGRSLSRTWADRGGAQAYLGLAMDGFPNFFFIFGPNTATGHSSVILASENMVGLTLKLAAPVLRGDAATVEVNETAQRLWTDRVQAALRGTVFNAGGARNWYVDASGWNSSVYPWTQVHHTLRCMFPRWSDWHIAYTPRGRRKLWVGRLARGGVLIVALVVAAYARRHGRAAVWQRLQIVVQLAGFSVLQALARLRGTA